MASGTRTIAEVAEEFGVTHRTVRVFHPRDRVRLGLVLRGKRLGFPLEEIRRIVDMYDDVPGEAGQLEYLLGQIDERRAELEARRADIEAALAELDDLQRRCRADLDALKP